MRAMDFFGSLASCDDIFPWEGVGLWPDTLLSGRCGESARTLPTRDCPAAGIGPRQVCFRGEAALS
jgi:hypothetical protein